jgi:hypothetical protein
LDGYLKSQESTGLVSAGNIREANELISEMIDFLEGKIKK